MTHVYELSSSGALRSVDSAGAPPGKPPSGVVRWVRIVGSPQDLRAWLTAAGLPDASIAELHDDESGSRVVVENRTVIAVLPVVGQEDRPAPRFRAVCTPATLVTAEEEALPAIDVVVTEWCAAPPARTLPELFVDVLEAAVSNGGEQYLALRRTFDEVAEAVETHPLDVPAVALLAMKRRVAQLWTAWEGQSYCLIEIKRRRSHVSQSDGARERLADLVSDADRALKLLAHVEGRVRDLRLYHMHCLNESTNRRLNVLAVLSAIYMPPTLIAGIYGMNLERIPMTQLPHGYLIVMSMMAVVVLGQWWYFRRRGWFT